MTLEDLGLQVPPHFQEVWVSRECGGTTFERLLSANEFRCPECGLPNIDSTNSVLFLHFGRAGGYIKHDICTALTGTLYFPSGVVSGKKRLSAL